jgi:hypothetical protein
MAIPVLFFIVDTNEIVAELVPVGKPVSSLLYKKGAIFFFKSKRWHLNPLRFFLTNPALCSYTVYRTEEK